MKLYIYNPYYNVRVKTENFGEKRERLREVQRGGF
jgi:hypothetical protein